MKGILRRNVPIEARRNPDSLRGLSLIDRGRVNTVLITIHMKSSREKSRLGLSGGG